MKINISEAAKNQLDIVLKEKKLQNHPLRLFIQSFG